MTHKPEEHAFLMAPTEEAIPPEVFWAKSGDAYPILIKLARTFLGIPASSGSVGSSDVNRGSKNRNSLQFRVLEIEFLNSKLDFTF